MLDVNSADHFLLLPLPLIPAPLLSDPVTVGAARRLCGPHVLGPRSWHPAVTVERRLTPKCFHVKVGHGGSMTIW